LTSWTDWTPSSRSKRWKRRKKKKNEVARAWMRLLAVLVFLAGAGMLGWQIKQDIAARRSQGSSIGTAALEVIQGTNTSPWQENIMDSLDKATGEVGEGEVAQAEVDVDRAASLLNAARRQSQHASPDFFQMAVSELDGIWDQRPENEALFEHVTQARIELATLRSAENVAPSRKAEPAAASVSSPAPPTDPNVIPAVHSGVYAVATPPVVADNPAAKTLKAAATDAKRLSTVLPHAIAANSTLNPSSFGKGYLDATSMPSAAEILLPPASRSLADNVIVEDLTIAGASQTLDGIRWRNVIFVGTRLRYEKGPIDLENVRFVGCTFGLATDVRGARLATAIALGQNSFSSE
jgi:hypothetical protein